MGKMLCSLSIPQCCKEYMIVTAIQVSSSNLGMHKTIFSINIMNMQTVVNNFSVAASVSKWILANCCLFI